ncbi:thiopeptide-type bacteriocin biosynthesis protein [Streptomyces sp. 8N114]|uniref:thiopeptide-type bacteriocin biosynthesis protein n=1 Tax=Streptomyces sp. 8N114 TaxID=3457419 RepID=UPI003FD0696F
MRSRGRAALSVGVAAGLAAARDSRAEAPWAQVNLAVEQEERARAHFCAELGMVAREFLGADRARNFFFMHKEAGMRVRFQASVADGAAPLRAALLRRLARCEGARTRPVCVVYEPEQYLFGGPASMAYVHDLFTLDSFAWLDHHVAHAGCEGQLTAWRQSLLLLRELFGGLGIVGWEHRGVWHALSREAGRGLRGAAAGVDPAARQQAAAAIVAYWRASREEALLAFPEKRRPALNRHAEAVRQAATRWRQGYFEAGEATVGPRTAVAYFTVCHWNRGRLSLARQGLLTDVLASEGGFPMRARRPGADIAVTRRERGHPASAGPPDPATSAAPRKSAAGAPVLRGAAIGGMLPDSSAESLGSAGPTDWSVRVRRSLIADADGVRLLPVHHATCAPAPPYDRLLRLLTSAGHPPTVRMVRLDGLAGAFPAAARVPRLTVGGLLMVSLAQWRLPRAALWRPTDPEPAELAAFAALRRSAGLPGSAMCAPARAPSRCPIDLAALPGPSEAAEPLGVASQLLLRLPYDRTAEELAERAAAAWCGAATGLPGARPYSHSGGAPGRTPHQRRRTPHQQRTGQ